MAVDANQIGSAEPDARAHQGQAVRVLRIVIILTGFFLPLLPDLAVWVYVRLSLPNHFLTALYPINLESCADMIITGLFYLTWWPFAVYAIFARKLYTGLLDKGVAHPALVVLCGLIGLALPAGVIWFHVLPEGLSPSSPTSELEISSGAMYITLVAGTLIQAPTAIVFLIAARWVALSGDRTFEQ